MSCESRHSPSLEHAVLLLAIGALLTACCRGIGRTHRRRLSCRSRGPAADLQTWEGEGSRPVEHLTPDSPSPAVPAPPR